MIARLTGVVAEKRDDCAVLDVGGVGYRVFLSAGSLAALPPLGERSVLRIHTVVREDAIHLYGFVDDEEESVFRALLGVSQIGPKAALNILSGIGPRELALAVAQGDLARLTKAPGVGKKTAERLIVELKEKLASLARGAAPKRAGLAANLEQLEQALIGLGFKPQQAASAVEALRERAEGRSAEELLREALKMMRQS